MRWLYCTSRAMGVVEDAFLADTCRVSAGCSPSTIQAAMLWMYMKHAALVLVVQRKCTQQAAQNSV